MTSWNYRVMHKGYPSGVESFAIHEVYYNDAGEVDGWTAGPVEPSGETLEELARDLHLMTMALKLPVLEDE